MRIDVAASLTIESPAPATGLLQVAVASPVEETLTVVSGGSPVEPEEFEVDGARVHRLALAEGTTTITYTAAASSGGLGRTVTPAAWAEALRPSRYCPSDQLEGFASAEFDRALPRAELVRSVADWVHGRLTYTSGSSRPVDTAVDTLLTGQGVCRDYAHLTVTLLRALEGRPGWSPSTRRGWTRWTSTPSSRPTSTAPGAWSTRPGWLRRRPWCGSAPAATRPTRRSSPCSAASPPSGG
ncbi:transglutaminase family protein [Blastococcus sp. SYSU D00669]